MKSESLNFSWGKNEVLKDISFSIEPNQIVSVLGVNGAGKSTLIKCLNGILKPESGEVEVIAKPDPDSEEEKMVNISSLDLVGLSKVMSYVPQSVRSSFSMDVFDVV